MCECERREALGGSMSNSGSPGGWVGGCEYVRVYVNANRETLGGSMSSSGSPGGWVCLYACVRVWVWVI